MHARFRLGLSTLKVDFGVHKLFKWFTADPYPFVWSLDSTFESTNRRSIPLRLTLWSNMICGVNHQHSMKFPKPMLIPLQRCPPFQSSSLTYVPLCFISTPVLDNTITSHWAPTTVDVPRFVLQLCPRNERYWVRLCLLYPFVLVTQKPCRSS